MSEQTLTPNQHYDLAAALGLDLSDLAALGPKLTSDDMYISPYAMPLDDPTNGNTVTLKDGPKMPFSPEDAVVSGPQDQMFSTDNATVNADTFPAFPENQQLFSRSTSLNFHKTPAQDSVDPLCITTKDLTITNPEPDFLAVKYPIAPFGGKVPTEEMMEDLMAPYGRRVISPMPHSEGPPHLVRSYELKLKRCREEAVLPTYGTTEAACFDLYAAEYAIIPPEGTVAVGIGWKTEFKEGLELQIRSRSGMALKGIVVANAPGTIDSDYRGEVKIILHNNTPQTCEHQGQTFENIDYVINPGDRIAQGIMQPVTRTHFTVVEEISTTDRGAGGLGHTGK